MQIGTKSNHPFLAGRCSDIVDCRETAVRRWVGPYAAGLNILINIFLRNKKCFLAAYSCGKWLSEGNCARIHYSVDIVVAAEEVPGGSDGVGFVVP